MGAHMAAEVVSLVMKLDSTDAVKAAENLDKVTAAGEKTEETAKRVQRSWERTIERVAAEANGLNGRFDVLNGTQNKMLVAVERIAAQMDKMSAAMDRTVNQTNAAAQAATKNAEALDKMDRGARNAAAGMSQVDKDAKGAAAGLGEAARSAKEFGQAVASGDLPKASSEALNLGRSAGVVSVAFGVAATATLGLVAGAGLLAVAYYKGSQESVAYDKALTLTGSYAGKTSGQLADMAERISAMHGTTAGAASVLAQVASTGRIAGDAIEDIGLAAVAMNKATGQAVSETIAEFVQLADAPARASAKLNEQYHYLTASVYEQIKALEEQGRKDEAASLAQKSLADMHAQRAAQVIENVGYMERAWASLKGVVTGTWDAMLGAGREATLADQIKNVNTQIEAVNRTVEKGGSGMKGGGYDYGSTAVGVAQASLARLEATRDYLQGIADTDAFAGKVLAAQKTLDEQQIAQSDTRAAYLKANKGNTLATALEDETKRYNEAIRGLEKGTEKYREILASHEAQVAKIEKRFKQKTESGGIKTSDSELASLNARIEAEKQRAAQLELSAGAQAQLNEGEKLALQYAEKIKLATNAKTIAELAHNKALASQLGALMRKNDESGKEQKLQFDTIDRVKKQTQSIQDQVDTYGLGKSAIEQMVIARLEERLAIEQSKGGAQSVIDGIQQEIEARKELRDVMGQKEVLDKQKKAWTEWERDIGQIFQQVGQSLTDAIFEGGKSGKELLKSVFKSLTLNVLINPIMGALQGAATNSLGAMFGLSNPGQGGSAASSGMGILNMASNLSSLNTGFGALSQAITGATAGASTASLAYANAVGMMGGDSIGALISANGGWAGAMAGNAATWGTTVTGLGSALPATASWAGGAAGLTGTSGLTIGSGVAASMGTGTAGTVGVGAAGGAGGAASSMSLMGPLAIIAGVMANSAFYKQGWDATNGSLNTGVGAVFGGATGTIHKALEGLGMGGYLASMLSGSAITSRLFGMKNKEYTDHGIAGRFATSTSVVDNFQRYEQKGGVFRKNKNGTEYSAVDQELKDFIDGSLIHTTETVKSYAKLLDITTDAVNDFQRDFVLVFNGLSAEESQQKLVDELKAFGDEMVATYYPQLESFARSGESAGETMIRLAEGLTGVNSVMDLLGLQTQALNLAGAAAASSLMDMLGGMEGFTQLTTSYYQNYFSEAERAAAVTEQLTKGFASLGQTLPESREQFRALVGAQDLSTDAGLRMFAALMQLEGVFASVTLSTEQLAQANEQLVQAIAQQRLGLESQLLQLQGNTAELRARELAALDESNRALQEHIWAIGDATTARQKELDVMYAFRAAAETAGSNAMAALTNSVNAKKSELQQAFDDIAKALNTSIGASQSAVSTLESMANRLRSTLDTMRGQTDDAASRAWAQAQISQARIAGVAPDTKDFEQALSIVSKPSEGLFATFEDYQLDFLKTANDIFALSDITGKQLTIEQQTLATLKDQLKLETSQFDQEMRKYDEMVTLAQQQLDVALGNNNILLTIPAALAAIAAAIGNIKLTAPASYLSQNADVAKSYIDGQGGNMTAAEYAAYHYAAYGAGEGRGDAGLSLSPEQAYIANNPDVAAAFNTDGRSNNMTLEDYAKYHYTTFGAGEGRAFAKGGYYPGGMALVGEEGPELINFKNPGMVYTASQTRNLMGGGGNGSNAEVVSELKSMRAENKAQAQAIVQLQSRIARMLEEWNGVGIPETRELIEVEA